LSKKKKGELGTEVKRGREATNALTGGDDREPNGQKEKTPFVMGKEVQVTKRNSERKKKTDLSQKMGTAG